MLPCLLIRMKYFPKAHLSHLVLPESLHYTVPQSESEIPFLPLLVNQRPISCSWNFPADCNSHPLFCPAGHCLPCTARSLRATLHRGSPQVGLLHCHFGSRLSRVTTCQSQLQNLLAKGFEERVKGKQGSSCNEDVW